MKSGTTCFMFFNKSEPYRFEIGRVLSCLEKDLDRLDGCILIDGVYYQHIFVQYGKAE